MLIGKVKHLDEIKHSKEEKLKNMTEENAGIKAKREVKKNKLGDFVKKSMC